MKFYITTAIDYPNARPHIGTAFEKIGADVQARFQRFLGNDVFFLMGNDENTGKVVAKAKELNEDTKSYVNRMAKEFKSVWEALDISNDHFIQTGVDYCHTVGVKKFLEVVNKAGYIKLKFYSGLYCEDCEEFKLEKNLTDKLCPVHKKTCTQRDESNYFFELSAFRERLLELFDKGTLKIVPESRLNEVRNFIEKDLEDISISRVCTANNQGWGIPFPWDDKQVVYVWFDALLNYLTGIGFGTNDAKFKKWWPADIHFVGKDITRFHCALWPAMIMAYNEAATEKIDLPKMVFGHGFVCTPEGKVSKSGTHIDPVDIVNKYGSDAYRYFFLSKCPFDSDSDYTSKSFNEAYNADFANKLGNLLSRVCNMMLLYFQGNIYQLNLDSYLSGNPWVHQIDDWIESTKNSDYREGLDIVWDIVNRSNSHIERCKPWDLSKNNPKECAVVLIDLVVSLRLIATMLKPYLPKVSKAIYESFNFKKKWEELNIKYLKKLVEDHYIDLEEPQYFLCSNGFNVGVSHKKLINGKFPPLLPRVEFKNEIS